ncbi:hypothetical protein [Sphingomicrobium nitratireducens]|uniref:hypothetical protein n=1 Tax=Sphingomicrobium nitratireducens TaxID=2964666 RepID=UPI0022409CD0|nr:hypothetical protein [Sphingomicrobium nitratireducens]
MDTTAKTPVHLWIVGIVSLLWNAGGAYDYLMSMTRNEDYLAMAGIPVDEMLDWIDAFPVWAAAGWALGVWGAVAGSALLLMRNRHAVTAFAISLVGIALSSIAQYLVVDTPAALQGAGHDFFALLIIVVGIALFFYARAMRAKGVLR